MTTETMAPHDKELPIMQHLLELRSRLIKCVIALAVGTGIGTAFARQGLEILLQPLPFAPQTLAPSEAFVVYFRVALIAGVIPVTWTRVTPRRAEEKSYSPGAARAMELAARS